MKHLEPTQKPISKTEEKSVPYSSVSTFKIFLIGMALVAGSGYGMTALWNGVSRDHISEVRKSELTAEFSKLESIEVEPVPAQNIDAALNSMHLPPDQLHILKRALSSNDENSTSGISLVQADKTVLVWISLWDFAAPDGDVIHLSTAGYELDVLLQKLENKIAVPIDASKTIKITGLRDGGGGITLGIKSAATVVSMPVLLVGQTLSLPLSY